MNSDVNKKIFEMSVFILLLTYNMAGFFMIIENMSPTFLYGEPYSFHVTLYFTCVTLLTVGYGDYYPQTSVG